MSVYALSQNDVEALAAQTAQGMVHLIAVDYNWGPPIPGRFDTDFLRIWAVAQGDGSTGAVFLQGAQQGKWSINTRLGFQRVLSAPTQSPSTYGLYFLELGSSYGFPDEFVIRFDKDGTSYYDDNGGFGHNYHLVPNQGHGASAIAGAEAIFALPDISPTRLFSKSSPAVPGARPRPAAK